MLNSLKCDRNYDARYRLLVLPFIEKIYCSEVVPIFATDIILEHSFFPVESRSLIFSLRYLFVEDGLIEVYLYTGTQTRANN